MTACRRWVKRLYWWRYLKSYRISRSAGFTGIRAIQHAAAITDEQRARNTPLRAISNE